MDMAKFAAMMKKEKGAQTMPKGKANPKKQVSMPKKPMLNEKTAQEAVAMGMRAEFARMTGDADFPNTIVHQVLGNVR